MTPGGHYVEACREVLRCTRELAAASQRGEWEVLLAHLVARQKAIEAADRLPPPTPAELATWRSQALPLLVEAAELNRTVTHRVRRLRDLLRPVMAGAESHFLDTYR